MPAFTDEILIVLAQAYRMADYAEMTEVAAFIKLAMVSAKQQRKPKPERKAG